MTADYSPHWQCKPVEIAIPAVVVEYRPEIMYVYNYMNVITKYLVKLSVTKIVLSDTTIILNVEFLVNITRSYCPPTKLREGDVFTGVSVILFRGSPCDHYPLCIESHCTAPPLGHKPHPHPSPTPETCSNLFI